MGSTPGYVTASPDGRGIYVAEPDAGTVAVVDTATNKVTSTIPIPTGPPRYLAFSTDGSKIYVSVWHARPSPGDQTRRGRSLGSSPG
jgi:YVTN family beta-propeller protein